MKKKLTFILIILVAVITACNKDYLNSTPIDKYSDETVWKDMNLATMFLSGIYSDFPTEYNDNATSMLASMTDEADNNRSFEFSNTINTGQFTAFNFPYNSLWPRYYTIIRKCNVLMENISTVPGDAAIKKRMVGEARFLRAFAYHNLHNFFGEFPIVTSSLELTEDLFIPRASEQECVKFMMSELDSSAALLSLKYTGKDIGRVTKGAALALKSRVALFAGLWQQASDAAKAVMDLNQYSLFNNYAGIFYPQNDNNVEVIFDRQYIGDPSASQGTNFDFFNVTPGFNNGGAPGVTDPTQNHVDRYDMLDGTKFDWSNPQHAARPYFNRDPRMDASIIHDSSVWNDRNNVPKIIDMRLGQVYNPTSRPSTTGYYIRKFMDPGFQHFGSPFPLSAQNFIFIRYAEVLLNYAEAQFKLGNIDEARKIVNQIRDRPTVKMPPIALVDMTWVRFMNERTIELSFEGLRIWDVRRWQTLPTEMGGPVYGVKVELIGGVKKYTTFLVETRYYDPKMYLFPIPKGEVDKYPADNPLKQNPGWN